MGRNRKRTSASVGAVTYRIVESGSSGDITKELGDWSTYPPRAKSMFQDGVSTLAAFVASDERWSNLVRDKFGLDPANPAHLEVVAAVAGITSAEDLTLDDDEENTILSSGLDSSGRVSVWPSADGTRIDVDIGTFAKLRTSNQPRLAYAMIRRMVWGMRQWAEIQGVPPEGAIYLQAESDGMAMNGVETWAKLGFNFTLRRELRSAAEDAGFSSTSTLDLMTERNANGQLGFDAWNSIVAQVIAEDGSAEADGGFQIGDGSSSLRVLQRYGELQGY